MNDVIVRLAARGEGVTESGRFVPLTAPGDMVAPDGAVTLGPHRVDPPCRHFPECGGCQLQHVDDPAYADYLEDRIASALAAQGIGAPDILAPHLSPPRSRRRAALKAAGGAIGFNAAASHRIVDMRECHILRPELFALVAPLRRLLTKRASAGMTLADQGVDLLLEGVAADGLEQAEALTDFARAHGLARLSLDDGYGPQTIWEPEPVTITLSGTPVALPHGAFLQATAEGEAALVAAVREAVGAARIIADLFAGLGTFALALEGKVYAAEGARDAALAMKGAGRGLVVDHRDLFRRPLDAAELDRFEAIVLDPPRAGAREQAERLAASRVPRIAYVSCNPATFARDARTLFDGGFGLDWVKPVGQFRWSTHVELAAAFVR
ncbi:MAG TPA: class I SAM-dependent RNA methyltransferase [Allosphingosinicella sp.]|nr:class I SAM-dependent RNA methyltransferase [Allosphingosinicella sp.]